MTITSHSFDPSLEIGVYSFSSIRDWQHWHAKNPWFDFKGAPTEVAEHCKEYGMGSGWFGRISAHDVKCRSSNYRESLLGRGFNPRQRAMLEILQSVTEGQERNVRIYASEGITAFARELSTRFPQFVGSEFAPSPADQARIAPVQHQDLAALTYEDASFDICITNEVMEHFPDLETSLKDLRRILRVGGGLFSTFPFLHNRPDSLTKARVVDGGSIEHLTEPEYHGNPVDPAGRSLVFQLPAWDILEACRRAGFSTAEMVLLSSKKSGLISRDYPGIFLLSARA